MDSRMRAGTLLAGAALVALALAGCAAASPAGPSEGGGMPTLDGIELPKGAELAAWADGAIPENQTGGADYVVRASGIIPAGTDVGLDISELDGAGTLSIACLSVDGDDVLLQVDAPGDSGTETVRCGTPDDPATGAKTIVPISDAATLTVSSSSGAVFVYAVSPPGAEPLR